MTVFVVAQNTSLLGQVLCHKRAQANYKVGEDGFSRRWIVHMGDYKGIFSDSMVLRVLFSLLASATTVSEMKHWLLIINRLDYSRQEFFGQIVSTLSKLLRLLQTVHTKCKTTDSHNEQFPSGKRVQRTRIRNYKVSSVHTEHRPVRSDPQHTDTILYTRKTRS